MSICKSTLCVCIAQYIEIYHSALIPLARDQEALLIRCCLSAVRSG